MNDPGSYQRLAGKLIYLTTKRPDISYVAGIFSQFMHAPRNGHLNAIPRMMRYIKGPPGKVILYKWNGHMNVEAMTNIEGLRSMTDRKSTIGYYAFLLEVILCLGKG